MLCLVGPELDHLLKGLRPHSIEMGDRNTTLRALRSVEQTEVKVQEH